MAIANDRLVHAGDRVDGALIRSISAAGISYSRGARKRFAYAPEPWLEGCAGAASASQPASEPLIGVDVAGAPAGVFFEGLVENTPYNILVHPDVTGRVTISLKNVTLQQLLDATRDLYGLDYRHTAAGYLILPAALQTRIFHISYLDLRRYGVSNTRISSGQVTQGDYNSQYGNSLASPTQPATTATVGNGNDKTTIDTTGTSVMTRDDSDFWGNLEANLHAMVGDGPGSKVIIDPQSGIIVVRALPEQLAEVSDYLRSTEATVTRQVLLEAKIVEVDLNHAYQAGIDWAKVLALGGSHYFIGQSSPQNGFGTSQRPHSRQRAGDRGTGESDQQLHHQQSRRRVHIGGRFHQFRRLRPAPEHRGQHPRAVKPAGRHARQPEGHHQGRHRPVLRHRHAEQHRYRNRDVDLEQRDPDPVLLRRGPRCDPADRWRTAMCCCTSTPSSAW